jgi:hypothetical protein
MAIKVKATERGFLGKIREPGDVFEIADEKAFSKNWMVKVTAKDKAAEQDPPKA